MMYVLVVAISGGDVVATSVVAKSAPSSPDITFLIKFSARHSESPIKVTDLLKWAQRVSPLVERSRRLAAGCSVKEVK